MGSSHTNSVDCRGLGDGSCRRYIQRKERVVHESNDALLFAVFLCIGERVLNQIQFGSRLSPLWKQKQWVVTQYYRLHYLLLNSGITDGTKDSAIGGCIHDLSDGYKDVVAFPSLSSGMLHCTLQRASFGGLT